jgi:hypothetical protein
MPFTPFHLGFGVLLSSIFFPFVDPIALLLGTILIDLEPVVHLIFNVGQLHGVIHSLLGVIVFFIPISIISWGSFKLIGKFFDYHYNFKWYISLISSIVGLLSHIIFDAGLYSEMRLLYPFSNQTGYLFGYWTSNTAMISLSVMFAAGIIIIVIRFTLNHYKKKKTIVDKEIYEINFNDLS